MFGWINSGQFTQNTLSCGDLTMRGLLGHVAPTEAEGTSEWHAPAGVMRLYSTLLQTCSNLAIFHFRQKCLVRFNKQWVPNHSTGHRLLKDWKIHYTCRLLQKCYNGLLFFSACCLLLTCVCSCIMRVNYATNSFKERANVSLAAGSEPTSRTSLPVSSLCLLRLFLVLFSPTGKTLDFVHLSWGRRWRPEPLFFCQICRDYLQHDPISCKENVTI